MRQLKPAHWAPVSLFRTSPDSPRTARGLAFGASLLCAVAQPLASQVRGTIQVEATVLPAEGTRTFQLVRQMLRPAQPSAIGPRRPGDPMPLATIAIDPVAVSPGSAFRRLVVNIEYLRN
jgi:hypothetical protein